MRYDEVAMAVRAKRLLDFGPDVSVAVSPEAKARLNKLPQPAIRQLLDGLQDWAKDAPLKAARVTLYTDMEDEDWTEVSIDLFVDSDDDDHAFALVEQMAAAQDKVRHTLSPPDRAAIDNDVGIHLYWGNDRWDDQPSAV